MNDKRAGDTMYEQLDDKIIELESINNPTIIISDFERIENKINSLFKEINNIKRQRKRDIWFLKRK